MKYKSKQRIIETRTGKRTKNCQIGVTVYPAGPGWERKSWQLTVDSWQLDTYVSHAHFIITCNPRHGAAYKCSLRTICMVGGKSGPTDKKSSTFGQRWGTSVITAILFPFIFFFFFFSHSVLFNIQQNYENFENVRAKWLTTVTSPDFLGFFLFFFLINIYRSTKINDRK